MEGVRQQLGRAHVAHEDADGAEAMAAREHVAQVARAREVLRDAVEDDEAAVKQMSRHRIGAADGEGGTRQLEGEALDDGRHRVDAGILKIARELEREHAGAATNLDDGGRAAGGEGADAPARSRNPRTEVGAAAHKRSTGLHVADATPRAVLLCIPAVRRRRSAFQPSLVRLGPHTFPRRHQSLFGGVIEM